MKNTLLFAFITVAMLGTVASCKKIDKTPPAFELVTLPGYTQSSGTVGKNDTLRVGIRATKAQYDLENFSVTVTYDNFTTYTTRFNRALGPENADSLRYDYLVITRNQTGKEKWTFTVSDKENNVANLVLTFTVI